MTESEGGVGSQAGPGAAAPLTRGFLFADLRGYTAYMDQRGATAGALLVDRFRGIVRAAVAVHQGAEIRTEGDSFYVVFPSASMAVACALDIVRAAADEVVSGDEPIAVGVGVHAGEALETPDGPVGTAVNIAARLCAMAGPGEVVVSDTVRALTRSVGAAGFVPLGRRPIKGLDESLSVYRAVPAGSAIVRPGDGSRRRVVAGAMAILAGLAVVAAGVVVLARPGGTAARPSASGALPSSSAVTPRSSASAVASKVPVGIFASSRFAVPFRISLGQGWGTYGEVADNMAFHHPGSPEGWIDVLLVAAVLDPPCSGTDPMFIGEEPKDIIDWLASREWLDHGAPRPYNIGAYLGRSVDYVLPPPGGRWACPDFDEIEGARLFELGLARRTDLFGSYWGSWVGERKRVIAIDVAGQTVTLVSGGPTDVESFWRLTEPLLQTIEFLPPPE
jgi:class 3 adenylate cyclase